MKYGILFILLFTFTQQYAQSEPSIDRFIRIVGIAEHEIESEGLRIEFTLTEIAGNEYQQIRPKSIEEVKSEFIRYLESENIAADRIEHDYIKDLTKTNYNKTEIENYSIEVADEMEAMKLSKLKVDGFKIGKVDYLFKANPEDFIEDMTLQAIEDAKRKATNIAQAVGKEIGDILNIEDLKTYNASGRYSSQSDTKKLTYNVNVTFELK